MKKVGIIGWRGMVGSVLMKRMEEEKDFDLFQSYLFSTSLKGEKAPNYPHTHNIVLDSNSAEELSAMDFIITCQGGNFTKEMRPQLEKMKWQGIWIDAASAKRMDDDSLIVLDPINKDQIEKGLNSGVKNFVGGNCTVSLMLMALGPLFKEGLVEWMTSMTYQAASGAGARNMMELLQQFQSIGNKYDLISELSALEVEAQIQDHLNSSKLPKDQFGYPLALSLLPWIDTKVENGQSREEWKAQVEANKILGNRSIVPIDGTCVRVGALRCHSQAFTIKLKKSVEIKTLESLIAEGNEWVEFVENEKEATLAKLTPANISGTLKIPVGRLRKMTIGDDFVNAFSIGDQLLWGAAEPLRRVLRMAL